MFLLLLLPAFGLTAPVQATTIIWVSDNKTQTSPTADQGWVDLLRNNGYIVDYKGEDGSTDRLYWRTLDAGKIAELNAADLVIVSRDSDSGQYDDGTEPADSGFGDSLGLFRIFAVSPLLTRVEPPDWGQLRGGLGQRIWI